MNIVQKVEAIFFRRKKLKNNFFEGFIFEKKYRKVQNAILTWDYQLQCQGIFINKFADLWKECEKIIFPVFVDKVYCDILRIDLHMKDSKGVAWYITINHLEVHELEKYDIDMVKQDIQIWYRYEADRGSNRLKEKRIIFQKKREEDKFRIWFQYDTKTKAILEKGRNQLLTMYEKQEWEELIYLYLSSKLAKTQLTDDVFTNFVSFVKILEENGEEKPYSISMQVVKEDKEVSKIIMKEGVVTHYSYTIRKNENEKCFHELTFQKKMEEFVGSKC